MTKTSSRLSQFFAGLLGGLVVLVAGAVLIATGVIDTGDESRTVIQQEPVARPAADGGEEGSTVNQIFDRAAPGVVFIQARGATDESPFGAPQREGTATGTGFVLDDEGFILTNAHVVEGSDDVQVRFGEEDPIDAEVIGRDPSTDLAVLKVKRDADKLTPIPMGDSAKAQVGDPVIAIGNPFGFDSTVTTGIISALQRQITAPNNFSIDNVLQTDASVNPGNSGGPLLDGAGRAIGINSQIATGGNSSGSVGIAFAVPINTAKSVIPQLKKDGKIERAYLGVTTAPVSGLSKDLNLPAEKGALVQSVEEGGPSDKAGLKGGRTRTEEGIAVGGDLIVKVDGKDIAEPADVASAIADDKPGKTIEIEFFRGGKRQTERVKLGTRPAKAGDRGSQPRGGGGGGGDEPPGGGGDNDGILPFP